MAPPPLPDTARPMILRERLPVFALPLLLASACGGERTGDRLVPSIQFSAVAPAGAGGSERTVRIAGRVTGAASGQRIVLYARSGHWWVQPLTAQPFTKVQPDGTWENVTHLGTEYAAPLRSEAR